MKGLGSEAGISFIFFVGYRFKLQNISRNDLMTYVLLSPIRKYIVAVAEGYKQDAQLSHPEP